MTDARKNPPRYFSSDVLFLTDPEPDEVLAAWAAGLGLPIDLVGLLISPSPDLPREQWDEHWATLHLPENGLAQVNLWCRGDEMPTTGDFRADYMFSTKCDADGRIRAAYAHMAQLLNTVILVGADAEHGNDDHWIYMPDGTRHLAYIDSGQEWTR